jgi:ABC-type siderophore export system fused ATPase/permease subunit
MNSSDPQFWMMVSSIIIAICFIVMAIALIAIAVIVKRVVATVRRVEERIDPLITQVNSISKQGKEMSVHFNEVTANLATATKYLAESTELIKDEVAELKVLVGHTALVAKDKVEMVSKSIDKTHNQVMNTTEFINTKVVVPAREIAAVMAGVKKGLEVLFAPSPKQIDRVYADDEMFIG